MCCIFTIFMFFGPRVGGAVWWLFNPGRWVGNTAFSAFDSFIWPMLGLIFVPYTTIMYVIVFRNGIVGFEWFFLGLMLLADIGSLAGGGYSNRDQFKRA